MLSCPSRSCKGVKIALPHGLRKPGLNWSTARLGFVTQTVSLRPVLNAAATTQTNSLRYKLGQRLNRAVLAVPLALHYNPRFVRKVENHA